jgi:Haem-binding domain
MKAKILIGLVILLVVIQFFRPEKNLSGENTYDISSRYMLSDSVKSILKVSCNDCHSNQTEYPWYAEVQPVAWWLNNHITDGKRQLNLSNFTSRSIADQNHMFEETVEVLEENEMPLSSYTWLGLHSQANLTNEQKSTLIRWAKAQMDTLKANYPPDSLVRKKRNPS